MERQKYVRGGGSVEEDFEFQDMEIEGTFASAFNVMFGSGDRHTRPRGVDPYVILPQSRAYRWWAAFILLWATYSSFFTPFEFGFFRGLSQKMSIVENLVQVLFTMDAGLQFFVAYKDTHTYKYVYEKRLIALRYLKSSFVLDILSCVPWDAVYKATDRREWVRYMLWVRLYRAMKVHNFFNNMEKDIRINYLFTRILKLITVELYVTHTAACIFYYLATTVPASKEGYTWIGSLTLGDYSYQNFRDIGIWRKYITSLYFAIVTMATVGYGDIHAVSIREMIFIMIYISFDMILGAYLIGNMTALIVKGSKTERFRDKMADIMKFMNRNKLGRDLRTEIKNHQRLQYETSYNEAIVLQDIPVSIRAKVAHRLYKNTVEEAKLFRGCSSDFINQVITKLHEEFFLPGDVIMERGQAADQFYIVSHGTLEEVTVGEEGSEQTLSRLDSCNTFGEVAVFCNIPQPFTVRALELSRILRIGKEDFANILQLYFTDAHRILQNLIEENDRHFRIKHLASDIGFLITKQEAELVLRVNNSAYHGDLMSVQNLVRAGADPRRADYDGRTALHLAASKGYEDIVAYLVKMGADVNHIDKFGNSPLLEAVKSGHYNIAAFLVKEGALLHLQDSGTYLCKAVKDGQTGILKCLLESGVDPNSKDYNERTPLHLAASEGLHLAAKVLLDYGACTILLDRWGKTPLDEALQSGNKFLIQMLENAKDNPHSSFQQASDAGSSSLEIPLQRGHVKQDHILGMHPDKNSPGVFSQIRKRCTVFPYHPSVKGKNKSHGIVMWVPSTLEKLFEQATSHFGFSGTCVLTENGGKILDIELIQNDEKLYLFDERGVILTVK